MNHLKNSKKPTPSEYHPEHSILTVKQGGTSIMQMF